MFEVSKNDLPANTVGVQLWIIGNNSALLKFSSHGILGEDSHDDYEWGLVLEGDIKIFEIPSVSHEKFVHYECMKNYVINNKIKHRIESGSNGAIVVAQFRKNFW